MKVLFNPVEPPTGRMAFDTYDSDEFIRMMHTFFNVKPHERLVSLSILPDGIRAQIEVKTDSS